jgi:predicted acyltransferase
LNPENLTQEKMNLVQLNQDRVLSIDAFRGFAIVLMVWVNTISHFPSTPWWTNHAYYNHIQGITFPDLILPMFIFIIGLNFRPQYLNSIQKMGKLQAILKYTRRFLAYVGIGTIASFIVVANQFLFTWGVLQAIGLAGMFTLIFVRLGWPYRLTISLVVIIGYVLVLGLEISTGFTLYDSVITSEDGGYFGGFVWGAFMLLTTVIAELFHRRHFKRMLFIGLGIILLGYVLHFSGNTFSKQALTIPYLIVSMGYSTTTYCVFWWIYDILHLTHQKSPFLARIGRNAIVLYVYHGVFILFAWILLGAQALFGYVALYALINIGVTFLMAYILDRLQIYFTL